MSRSCYCQVREDPRSLWPRARVSSGESGAASNHLGGVEGEGVAVGLCSPCHRFYGSELPGFRLRLCGEPRLRCSIFWVFLNLWIVRCKCLFCVICGWVKKLKEMNLCIGKEKFCKGTKEIQVKLTLVTNVKWNYYLILGGGVQASKYSNMCSNYFWIDDKGWNLT